MRIEKRRAPRFPVDRPLKLQCLETGRYFSGHTTNVSSSGALVHLQHPSLLVPGQRLKVGIAWRHGQAIIPKQELAEATVVRHQGLGGHQYVAVAFASQQVMALTA